MFGKDLVFSSLFSIFRSPGTIKPEWSKEHLNEINFQSEEEMEKFKSIYPELNVSNKKDGYTYCFICNLVQPRRAYHCTTCNRCFLKMERHCWLLGNCIGFNNHKYFFKALFFGTLFGIFVICTWTKDIIFNFWLNLSDVTIMDGATFAAYMVIIITFFTCLILFCNHIKLAIHNLTTRESKVYTIKV